MSSAAPYFKCLCFVLLLFYGMCCETSLGTKSFSVLCTFIKETLLFGSSDWDIWEKLQRDIHKEIVEKHNSDRSVLSVVLLLSESPFFIIQIR